MKTKILNFFSTGWQVLTEVPGWPDAPRSVRFRRALPFILPCVAILLLTGWNYAVRNPQMVAQRAAHGPLLALKDEIDALRLDCSDRQALEVAARAAGVSRMILDGPQQLGPILQLLKKEAADRHWEANFQAGEVADGALPAGAQLIFLPARAKLAPPAGQPGSVAGLLALLEQYSAAEKRIDLTRLAIRADEQGRYAVEVNLRLACFVPNEKTAQ